MIEQVTSQLRASLPYEPELLPLPTSLPHNTLHITPIVALFI